MTVFVPAFLLGIALKHDMHQYWHFNGFQHNWYQFWTLTFPWMTMTRAQTACYCSSWTERHRRMKSFVDAISAKHSFGERPLSRIQRPSKPGERSWKSMTSVAKVNTFKNSSHRDPRPAGMGSLTLNDLDKRSRSKVKVTIFIPQDLWKFDLQRGSRSKVKVTLQGAGPHKQHDTDKYYGCQEHRWPPPPTDF